jgi:Domain of unknown function (DUF4333)
VRRRLALVAVAAFAAAVFVSTGSRVGAAELSRTPTRRAVERSVHEAYPDLVFGNVACPAGVERRRGAKFTCTVQLPGTFLVVDAVQTDGAGNVSLSTQQAVIPSQLLGQFVAVNSSLPATVDCGAGPWRVARPGEKISCGVTLADGTARTVELTVQDTAGNVTISAVT